jgi:hypothetical protein
MPIFYAVLMMVVWFFAGIGLAASVDTVTNLLRQLRERALAPPRQTILRPGERLPGEWHCTIETTTELRDTDSDRNT